MTINFKFERLPSPGLPNKPHFLKKKLGKHKNNLTTYNRWVSWGTPLGNRSKPRLAQSTVVPKQAHLAGHVDNSKTPGTLTAWASDGGIICDWGKMPRR